MEITEDLCFRLDGYTYLNCAPYEGRAVWHVDYKFVRPTAFSGAMPNREGETLAHAMASFIEARKELIRSIEHDGERFGTSYLIIETFVDVTDEQRLEISSDLDKLLNSFLLQIDDVDVRHTFEDEVGTPTPLLG